LQWLLGGLDWAKHGESLRGKTRRPRICGSRAADRRGNSPYASGIDRLFSSSVPKEFLRGYAGVSRTDGLEAYGAALRALKADVHQYSGPTGLDKGVSLSA
jgi:hypothetical protein